nr:uncharacterized protein LOC102071129 [Zonotrichia albicollis]
MVASRAEEERGWGDAPGPRRRLALRRLGGSPGAAPPPAAPRPPARTPRPRAPPPRDEAAAPPRAPLAAPHRGRAAVRYRRSVPAAAPRPHRRPPAPARPGPAATRSAAPGGCGGGHVNKWGFIATSLECRVHLPLRSVPNRRGASSSSSCRSAGAIHRAGYAALALHTRPRSPRCPMRSHFLQRYESGVAALPARPSLRRLRARPGHGRRARERRRERRGPGAAQPCPGRGTPARAARGERGPRDRGRAAASAAAWGDGPSATTGYSYLPMEVPSYGGTFRGRASDNRTSTIKELRELFQALKKTFAPSVGHWNWSVSKEI